MQRIKKLIIDNLSLAIILLGAMSNFFLILFLKKDFPEIFTPLSLYLTYLGIIGSLGLLGFDQVYLRLAKVYNASKPSIGINVLIILMTLLLLVPLGFASYFSRYEYLSFGQLYLSGVAMNAVMLGFNANRLKKNFSISQSLKNSYKILFLIGAWLVLAALQLELPIQELFRYAALILMFCGAVSIISFWKNTIIENVQNLGVLLFAISFGLNITLITMLGYGERILIADKIDEETFSIYFYYLTIFLFPLTLLQEYVGFKELVYFKEKVEKHVVFKKIIQLIGLGIITYLLILMVVWIDNQRFLRVDLSQDATLIAWMSLLGLIKLIYSLFSAILGARGESNSINYINIITVLIIALLWLSMHFLGYSLITIIISLILVFLYRSIHTYILYVR